MKIEFENSIRRLSFLGVLFRLPDIKIAWINHSGDIKICIIKIHKILKEN